MESAVALPGTVAALPDNQASLHAKCSPSAAGRWVNCPGSVSLGRLFPDNEGEAAREGTASHYVASTVLEGCQVPPVGSRAPNGVVITTEMIEAAEVYIDAARSAMNADCTAHDTVISNLNVERPVNAFSIHPSACWGTPDLWYSFAKSHGGEIHIWDYKYGFGIVEPYENWQLITYASGIMDLLQIDGITDQTATVVMHIVQPRPFHSMGPHRQWRVLASDLRPYINQLAFAAASAMLPNPPTLSGDHCKYCSVRHACPAAQHAALFAVDYADTARIEVLTPEALAIELRTMRRAAAAIKYRLTALEAQAMAHINGGGHVPGFGLQRGQGRLAWNKPAAEIFALGDLLSIDLRAEPTAITPAAARKKGLDNALLSAYASPGDKGMELVATDKTLAAMVFKSAPVTGGQS